MSAINLPRSPDGGTTVVSDLQRAMLERIARDGRVSVRRLAGGKVQAWWTEDVTARTHMMQLLRLVEKRLIFRVSATDDPNDARRTNYVYDLTPLGALALHARREETPDHE